MSRVQRIRGGICQWNQTTGPRLFRKEALQRRISPAHPIRLGSLGSGIRPVALASKLDDCETLPWLISCTINSMGAELVVVVDPGSLIRRYKARGGEVRIDPRWCRPTWWRHQQVVENPISPCGAGDRIGSLTGYYNGLHYILYSLDGDYNSIHIPTTSSCRSYNLVQRLASLLWWDAIASEHLSRIGFLVTSAFISVFPGG